MINLLTPPTDNIYKFTSISGLIIFISMIIYSLVPSEHDRLENDIYLEMNMLVSKFNILRDEMIFCQNEEDSDRKKEIGKFNIDDIGKPIFRIYVYDCPINIQKKYQKLYLDTKLNNYKYSKFKSDESEYKLRRNIYLVLICFGEILSFWGFFKWYTQSTENWRLESQKILVEEYFQFHCQSCFKEFFFQDERGTNKDESLSKHFCNECISKGEF